MLVREQVLALLLEEQGWALAASCQSLPALAPQLHRNLPMYPLSIRNRSALLE